MCIHSASKKLSVQFFWTTQAANQNGRDNVRTKAHSHRPQPVLSNSLPSNSRPSRAVVFIVWCLIKHNQKIKPCATLSPRLEGAWRSGGIVPHIHKWRWVARFTSRTLESPGTPQGGPQPWSGRYGEEKKNFSLWGIEPRFSYHSVRVIWQMRFVRNVYERKNLKKQNCHWYTK